MKARIITAIIVSIIVIALGGIIIYLSIPVAEKVTAKQFAILGGESCYAGDGRVSVHDPSVFQDNDGTFYVFGTHGCVAKSTDMINWENVASGVNDNNEILVPQGSTLREALAEPLSWTDAYQIVNHYAESSWETAVWAPDVIYNEAMGKYCYYASSSVWGTPHSVIWFGTSDNAEGPFKNIKCIVYSGFNNITEKIFQPSNSLHYSFTNIDTLIENGTFSRKDVKNATWFNNDGSYNNGTFPNCIDPTVFYDKEGNLQMVYGSYSGGVYIMPLDESTGEPDYEYMKATDDYDIYFGKRLSCTTEMNEWSGEGPYITYDSETDYYYLYISYCGLNALGGYNIREYRSESVDGPYLDAMGNNALDYKNTGTKLFGNYYFDCLDTAYLAAGHSSSIVTDDGKMFQIYHTRFNEGHEGHQVRVHQMARTENDWAVVLPFEYTGETIDENGIAESELVGEYEFINHGSISNGCANWENVNNILSPTQKITLNADGTITGVKVFKSVKANAKISYTEVSGAWKIQNGTAYATFTIDGVTYEGVFCKQLDESSEKQEKIVFSAMGNNNECIWGVQK